MASEQGLISFADRHAAIMDIMKALKTYLDLPKAELVGTAKEIEEVCAAKATSREDYLEAVDRKKAEFTVKAASADLEVATTTGTADEPGAQQQDVGRYRAIYHERSANATVYKTHDPSTGETVALKVVNLESQAAPHDIRREAKMIEMLSHPNVVKLLAAESIAGGLFALKLPFMRYDLASLSEKNVLSPLQKMQHLRSLFSALAAVHAAGILHRDVKPSNVLLDSLDGPAYLIDFGISWHKSLNGSDNSEPEDKKITDVGTGAYRPPELLFGCKEYGPALDMWAAGCTAAEVQQGDGATLFDAGEVTRDDFLGSDLRLLNSIFRKLGTPTEETWPEAQGYRDWGKIQFKAFPAVPWQEMLPNVDEQGRALVSELVVYSSSNRLSAKKALEHAFFSSQY